MKIFTSDFFVLRDQKIYSTTYIKLDDCLMDTLKCQLFAFGGTISVVRVWHNDSLVWEMGDMAHTSRRYIKIVK